MNQTRRRIRALVTGCVLSQVAVLPALAGSHTWDVWEIFSNADGTVQFIELREANGTAFETGLANHDIIANPAGTVYTMQNNVPPPTSNKSYLLATTAFAALPGAPTPDEIIPDNFIAMLTDNEIVYVPWDNATWTAGTLPTDGITSLNRTGPMPSALSPGTNSPTNYAGVTGTIDASGGGTSLPGVPDGNTGPPMLVEKLAPDGSSLSISWDAATCSDTNDHQILFGQGSGLPGAPGGTYTLQGARCNIGSSSPFVWNPTPNATDGSGLIWWLLVAIDGAGTEGPWGKHDGVNERNGTGPNGSSAQCGVSDKDLAATCGH